MRCSFISTCVLWGVLSLPCNSDAEPFANLDFENSPVPGNSTFMFGVSTAELFPSWTLRFSGIVQDYSNINNHALGGEDAALFVAPAPDALVIEGQHSAYLQAWFTGSGVSLEQAGDVPVGTQSLRFLARNHIFSSFPFLPGFFDIRFAGQMIPLVPLSINGGEVLYAGDMTALAGSSGLLKMGVYADLTQDPAGWAIIDAIEFSPLPVPEPGILGIVIVAIAALPRRSTRRESPRRGSN